MIHKWLILTDDDEIHELTHNSFDSPSAFTLKLRGFVVSPRFMNVGKVKDAIRDFGYKIKEIVQIDGNNFPIAP